MNIFKNKTDFEKKSIIISLLFTIVIHLAIVIMLSQVAKAEVIENRPISIEARILKKGKKDGVNVKNSKNKQIRRKKKKFMPDKIKKKIAKVKKKDVKKKVKKEVKKSKKDVVKLGKNSKEKKSKDKKSKKSHKEEVEELGDLLSSLNSINPAIPDDKVSKKGGLGAAKGDENGVEGGNEEDPNKSVAGSLYERRVAIKIKSRWKHQPLDDKNISVKIRLFIDPDGKIRFKILKKSSNQFFNSSITKTLNSINKIEPPADKFKKYYRRKGMIINFYPKK